MRTITYKPEAHDKGARGGKHTGRLPPTSGNYLLKESVVTGYDRKQAIPTPKGGVDTPMRATAPHTQLKLKSTLLYDYYDYD